MTRVQYPAEAEKEGIASILAVPIYIEEEYMGVLRIYIANRRRFTVDDIYFVCTAANMGATTIENAVLDSDDPSVADHDIFRQQLVELQWARWPGAIVLEIAASKSSMVTTQEVKCFVMKSFMLE